MLISKNLVIKEGLSGLDGLDLIKQNSFDLAFVDFNMPLMDGVQVSCIFDNFR